MAMVTYSEVRVYYSYKGGIKVLGVFCPGKRNESIESVNFL